MDDPVERLFIVSAAADDDTCELQVVSTKDASSNVWNVRCNLGKAKNTGDILAQVVDCRLADGKQVVVLLSKCSPMIYLLHVGSPQSAQVRLRLPTIGQCCDVGCGYLAVGISTKVYIYLLGTGQLVCTNELHYQPVTHVQLSDSGDFLLTAARDGSVALWLMSSLIRPRGLSALEPFRIWNTHSLPVNALALSKGTRNLRIYSASIDQAVMVYSVSSGDVLQRFVFERHPTAICTDPAEYRLFVGLSCGSIHAVSLCEGLEHGGTQFVNKAAGDFVGHKDKVTSLSVNCDATLLLSGSSDSSARLWDIASKTCLRSVARVSGAVFHASFVFITHLQSGGSLPVCQQLGNECKNNIDAAVVRLTVEEEDKEVTAKTSSLDHHEFATQHINGDDEISRLRKANHALYLKAVDRVIGN